MYLKLPLFSPSHPNYLPLFLPFPNFFPTLTHFQLTQIARIVQPTQDSSSDRYIQSRWRAKSGRPGLDHERAGIAQRFEKRK